MSFFHCLYFTLLVKLSTFVVNNVSNVSLTDPTLLACFFTTVYLTFYTVSKKLCQHIRGYNFVNS